MNKKIKPMYLLADSQLLFAKDEIGEYFLNPITDYLNKLSKAVYIGASNGDEPAFYDLFVAAMENIKIKNCSMIHSAFDEEDKKKLEAADLILLAGGDVKKGLQVLENTGMKDIILEKYYNGATIIGVSAGAIQLGWQSLLVDGIQEEIIDTLRIAPFLVDTGSNFSEWKNLKLLINDSKSMKRGIGIPAESGIVYHVDQTVEILNKPVDEFVMNENGMQETVLIPISEKEYVKYEKLS